MPHKDVLAGLFEIIDRYLEENSDRDTPVVEFKTPSELRSLVDLPLAEYGISDAELLELIQQYLKYSVRSGHPQFFNQLYQGFNLPGFAGEIVTAAANTSMYTYEVAPVATLIEQELIARMSRITGFPHSEGIFLPGGSNANMTAMLIARNQVDPSIRENGVPPGLVAFVSDQAHYSFAKAANLLGIGIANLVKVSSDDDGRMRPDELEREIEAVLSEGNTPFFVAATAGTTVRGAFDPIPPLSRISKKYGLWLHVDGALGASVLLSNRYRHMLEGVEQADSLAWNPHKTMGVPLICSALLCRQPGVLALTTSCDHSDYLFHDDDSPDLGKKSLQCGRKVDSLKLWLSWKYFGDRGYEKRIDHLMELAIYAEQHIRQSSDLLLKSDVYSFTVCFQYEDQDLTPENRSVLNRTIRDLLLREGKSAVNYATLSGETVLRIAFINPDISETDIDSFFDNVRSVANRITSNSESVARAQS
jgi:glutamate/tyrosine decarboxylase-like PLP-dependent enzyme